MNNELYIIFICFSVTNSKAKVYANVNGQKPREYWDYDNYMIEWNNDTDR